MKVLVTGGAGFIGSHVVDQLQLAGHEPRIYDRRPSPFHEPGEIDTFIGDLTDLPSLELALTGCDAVIHLAAVADVNDVVADPAAADRVNVQGTFNVLEAARLAGTARVVYGSTIWVYDGRDGELATEETKLGLPEHLYTATKLAGEMYCRSFESLWGMDCTILRFGIPYGPRARPAAVIPAFVAKALGGEPLTIAGTGSQARRFVYVEDLAAGIVRGLLPQASKRVFNLVGDQDVTILQIAEVVRDLVGDVEIVHTPARTGDFAGTRVCGERAAAELDWRPTTPFVEGVRRYLESVQAAPQPVIA